MLLRSNMAQTQMAGKQATADCIAKLLSMCRRLELDWVRVSPRICSRLWQGTQCCSGYVHCDNSSTAVNEVLLASGRCR